MTMEQQLDIFGALYEEYKITKPIRLIEFFSGYGSQNLALKYLGANYESWKICEWATKSIQAYNDLHHEDYTDYSMVYNYQEILDFLYNKGVSMNYNNPMTLEQIKRKGEKWCRNVFNNIIATNNLVNIQQVSGKDLNIVDTDKYDYVLTYSFPCVLAGYKVKAINGYKNIEDINTNDFVLTHTNNYKKVVKTMTRKKEGYYKIKYLGGTLELTDEHPMYVLRNDKFQWVKVKDLKLTDKLTINVNKESIDVEYDNKLLWLLGRYVADGHYNKYTYNSINFSISFEKEEEFLKNIPNEFVAKFKKYKKKCWDYRIADKNFKELCLQFNTGSKNKIIPQWILDLPKDKLQSFFDGYIAGDGYTRYRGDNKQIMFSTVSQNVFLAMQDIVLKLYGKVCSQYIREDKREKNYNNSYQAQVTLNENNKFQFIKEDKACVRIKEILFINEKVDVYNFEVEQDNSYTVNNIIVHNCQDLSLAGKRAGMVKGENTRSGMLWEVERILKECYSLGTLPKILLLENVTQLHSKENMPHFQSWLRELEKLGYSSYWQDMNSADYGVPQHRDRTFVVSILGDYYYEFPKKFPLKLVLADMLEDEVDEKYYLSEKMIKYISERGTGGFANADCRINLEVARPITTDPNKRAGTTNYLCNDLPSGFDLNSLCIKIPEATKKGYAEAYEGDGVYINRPHQKRGCVQKGLIQTLKTSPDDVGVVVRVGNYSPSRNNASTVVDSRGIAPTVMENHGTVTAIVEEDYRFFKQAIETLNENDCKVGDTINAYNKTVNNSGVSPTLTTRPEGFKTAILPVVEEKNFINILLAIFDLCGKINIEESEKYERSRTLLSILWEEITKEKVWKEIGRFQRFQEKEILQSRMYEQILFENRNNETKISSSSCNSSEYNEITEKKSSLFNLWQNFKVRYTPYRWELQQQQFEQLNIFMQELSYEKTSSERYLRDLRFSNERSRVLQQTLYKLQEIWQPFRQKTQN